ncbi:MAG: DUF898 family protein [Zoogloeaceae bacterium]|jgi:uncharacterized membrane protein YjgN (DUF898 family)|nr:DUF898 family protein [Zoogloeaceae bacterium]
MPANMKVDHYEVLGVPEHADAQAIETAYRTGLAKIRGSLGSSAKPLPPDFLRRLREAYRVLSDAGLRYDYDNQRHMQAEPVTDRQELTLEPMAERSGAALDTGSMSETSQVVVMGEAMATGEPLGFRFVGTGGDYFRIWIVNLVLSVLTLGIYSAWAKVRREQFFHRNTLLAGSGFDYHGNPKAILKGRIIAWTLLVLLSLSKNVNVAVYWGLLLCSAPILPWFILRSLKFRAANTSYRGLRFRHRGTYRQAFIAFVAHGIPAIFLGFWIPVWMRAIKRFQLDNLSYGRARFKCDPDVGSFFGAYIIAALVGISTFVVLGFLVGFFGTMMNSGGVPKVIGVLVIMALAGGFVLTFTLLIKSYLQVRLSNLTWNTTSLNGKAFISTQRYRSYLRIVAGNFFMVLLTLGLYWPWAKVREAAYRLEHLALENTDLNAFAGLAVGEISAVGEEIADAFDLDFSL